VIKIPFGEYTDFAECVRKNQDKRDPEAYCAQIHKDITGEWPTEKSMEFFTNEMNFEEIENKDGKKYFVTGYISTYDKDLVNDIVTPGCMKNMLDQLRNRSIKLDVEHESFKGKTNFEKQLNKTIIPIGRIIEADIDKKGIKIKAILNKAHSRFNEVWESIKGLFLDAFSIAYLPTSTQDMVTKDGTTRLLDKLNLFNVGLTGNPANPNCTMGAMFVKSLEIFNKNNMEEINMSKEELEKIEAKSKEFEDKNAELVKENETIVKEKEEFTKEIESLKEEIEALKEKITKKDAEDGEDDGETDNADKGENKELKEKVEGIEKQVKELSEFMKKSDYKAKKEDMKKILSEEDIKSLKGKNVIDSIK